jgi:hypothetical protein
MSSYAIRDSATMLRRNLLHVVRYPSMTAGVLLIPVFMMLLFRYAFGATLGAGIGTGTGGYINYLTPGIIVLAVSSASVSTAVAVNTDMTEGIINRFRRSTRQWPPGSASCRPSATGSPSWSRGTGCSCRRRSPSCSR